MKNKLLISLLSISLIISCSDDTITVSNEVEEFINEVLDIMETNSVNRKEINWNDFRNKVFKKVNGAQNIPETYIGIKEALKLLNDNHSFFIKPDRTIIFVSDINCYGENISPPSIPESIGYVKVGEFSGERNSAQAVSFAQDIQNQIKSEDNLNLSGWIVDLRGNSGGNMWPMLAGIGPILGDGIAGYFIGPDEDKNSVWGYSNGSSYINDNIATQLLNPYELINSNPKVAVLLDNKVNSSGEAIAISFIGRENTKSFGSYTCGRTTVNSGFKLSNNSTLVLAVGYMADRNRNSYGSKINPDLTVNGFNIIQSAVGWIKN